MGSSNGADDEHFDLNNFTFDEGFVESAGVRELSASDRLRTAERQRLEEAENKRRLQEERIARLPHRRAGKRLRERIRHATTVLVVLALLAGAAWLDSRETRNTSIWAGNDGVGAKRVSSKVPTPHSAESTTPLGVVPEVERTSAPYRFINKQPGSDEPVTYDPCRTISVVINDAKAPVSSENIVTESLDEVSRLTGLQFRVEGKTDEPYTEERQPFQPDRYGDRWAPVLIAWDDEQSVPHFAGNVAGSAGSDVLPLNAKHEVYVSGAVGLDATDAAKYLRYDEGRAIVKATVLHELAHLVGLDHVEDATQIMNPKGSLDVVNFAAGDRAGLARLGRGTCNAKL